MLVLKKQLTMIQVKTSIKVSFLRITVTYQPNSLGTKLTIQNALSSILNLTKEQLRLNLKLLSLWRLSSTRVEILMS
jgi:hypothetical protein